QVAPRLRARDRGRAVSPHRARGMKLVAAVALVVACGGSDTPPAIQFAGKGSFRFGAASAATQIEDQNTNTDWYAWTAPTSLGGMAKGTFVGDAVKGYSQALADVQLVSQ